VFGVEFHILILAVKCRGDELRPVLKQVLTDLTTGEGQGIERVEIDVRSY
jgi:hypothetical protein